MVIKSTGLGGAIVKNRAKLGKIKYAMMATRFARNEKSASDDVDLLVVGQIVAAELQALIADEQAKREREINYSFMDEPEFNFRVRRRDPFILKLLFQPRIMLLGDETTMLEDVVV